MRLFGSFKGCSIKIPPVRDGLVVLFLSSYKGENKMTPRERLLQMHIDWFPRGKWYRYGEKCTWIGKNVEFFLADSIKVPQVGNFLANKIAFYAGEPSRKQERMAKQLMELILCSKNFFTIPK